MFEYKSVYIDQRDNKRTKTFYFYISEDRAERMALAETTFYNLTDGEGADGVNAYVGIKDRVDGTMRRGNGLEMLAMWDWLVDNSYGELSDDGESFDQDPELLRKWKTTDSYSDFMTLLRRDEKFAIPFFNGIFPADMTAKAKEDPEFARHREELAKRGLA